VVSVILLALDILLTVAAGAAVTGMIGSRLRFEERVAIAIVAGVVLCSALTFVLSLGLGLTPLGILLAPLLIVAGVAAAAARPALLRWRGSWEEARARWRSREIRSFAAITIVIIAVAAATFGRAMSNDGMGNLVTGYWLPDWAQHLTTATSFAVGSNLPPANPLFSGQPLYYPFIPDFHAAMLLRLGASEGFALAAPQALLCVAIACLIISFAERLGVRRVAGVIAVLVCFIGGSLGFVGALSDACVESHPADNCTLAYVASHPVEAPGISADTLTHLPSVVTAQPRAYDGLLTDLKDRPIPDQQWHTPLMAWWLPQRSLVFGFATVLVVLTVLTLVLVLNPPS